MNHLKSLTLSFILMSILAVGAFAGETPGPPCVPGQTDTPPSQTSTPPCSQSVTDGSTDPSETNGPPSNTVDVTTIVEAVQLALSLF
jgi:hypothetical protein